MQTNEIQTLEPLGCSIAQACKTVGMGKGDFYREFIVSGRIKPVKRGKRSRTIVVVELRQAFNNYIAEKRAAESSAP